MKKILMILAVFLITLAPSVSLYASESGMEEKIDKTQIRTETSGEEEEKIKPASSFSPQEDKTLTISSIKADNSISWSLNNGVLTISGSGRMEDYSSSGSPWYSDRSSVSSIVVSEGITYIGRYAFLGTYATEVALPDSLTEIGEGAFYQCSKLTGVTIPDKTTVLGTAAFAECSALTEITLGSSVTEIGDYALQDTALTSLTLPASLTEIKPETCYNCKKLTEYVVASGNSTYSSAYGVLFNKNKTKLIRYPMGKTAASYSIPSGVTEIGADAFYMNPYLTSVTIPSTVKEVGDWAFCSCTALKTLTLPNSVTLIGNGTADSCTALTTAVIGNGIATVEYRTFYGCTSLTKVALGSGVKTLYNWAFYNCKKLSSINLPSGLDSIGGNTFYNCISLTRLTIPSTVTYVDSLAFYCCDNLSVSYPSTLTLMEDGSYMLIDNVSITGTFDYNSAYEVLTLVNKERSAQGLSALKMDQELLEAAMQRAAETNIYFSHTRPSTLSCFSISSKASAENIAAGQSSASAVMESWMNSSGHKANILGSSYQSIGVGCFTQGGVKYWVQIFGTGTAVTGSQPSNQEKSVTVALKGSEFSDCLSLYTSDGSSLMVGKTATYIPRIRNSGWSIVYALLDASSFSWSSTSAGTVSSKGVLTGVKAGTATVTAAVKKGTLSASKSMDITAVKKGSSYTIDKLGYKVTAASSSSKTVTVTGPSSKNTTSVTIPSTVKIGNSTYKVTGIDDSAFSRCKKLTTVKVGKNVTAIGKSAFYNCTSLKKVTGCTAVTSIGSKAFYKCTKLTRIGSKSSTVTLAKIKTIGSSAFYGCKALKKVNLTSTALTTISTSAFQGCTAMTSFTTKSTKLKSIGKKAFYGDKKLATVTLKTSKLTKSNVKTNAFKGIKSTCTFKVPSKKVSSYKKIFQAHGAGSRIKVKKG